MQGCKAGSTVQKGFPRVAQMSEQQPGKYYTVEHQIGAGLGRILSMAYSTAHLPITPHVVFISFYVNEFPYWAIPGVIYVISDKASHHLNPNNFSVPDSIRPE